jgi:hypothetical protein
MARQLSWNNFGNWPQWGAVADDGMKWGGVMRAVSYSGGNLSMSSCWEIQ